MICYKDMSFCGDSDQCATVDWWGKPGAPIALMPGRETCGKFKEAKDDQAAN